MKNRLVFAVALVAFAQLASADISIVDNHKQLTVDCAADPNVTVSGNHAQLTLTGTCGSVQLLGNHAVVTGSATSVMMAGNHNTATLAAVDDLRVTGNHNTATYQRALKRKATKVSTTGKFNKVGKAK